MFVCPQNVYVEILTPPPLWRYWDGALGRWSGHVGEKTAVYQPGHRLPPDTEHPNNLILDFQPPELWEINVCCLKSPSLWHFALLCKWTTQYYSTTLGKFRKLLHIDCDNVFIFSILFFHFIYIKLYICVYIQAHKYEYICSTSQLKKNKTLHIS